MEYLVPKFDFNIFTKMLNFTKFYIVTILILYIKSWYVKVVHKEKHFTLKCFCLTKLKYSC